MWGNTLYVNKKPYGFVQNFKFYKSSASDPDIQMDSASNWLSNDSIVTCMHQIPSSDPCSPIN